MVTIYDIFTKSLDTFYALSFSMNLAPSIFPCQGWCVRLVTKDENE